MRVVTEAKAVGVHGARDGLARPLAGTAPWTVRRRLDPDKAIEVQAHSWFEARAVGLAHFGCEREELEVLAPPPPPAPLPSGLAAAVAHAESRRDLG